MEKLVINGGKILEGEVRISGAKNAALPILMATLLSEEPITIHNVPRLHDVLTTLSLLEELGVQIIDQGASITLNAGSLNSCIAPYELVKTMRASVLVLGPLLGRLGEARVSLPGGCAIGARPIDQHIKGMAALGAQIELQNGYVEAKIATKLRGNEFLFDLVTVTGTENLLMAAVLAEGETIIKNAAREPEVCDLANFLNTLGAKITGIGTDTLVISGVPRLHGGEYVVMPDRIEAGTYLVAGAITRGHVRLTQVAPQTMSAVLEKFSTIGAKLEVGSNWIDLDMQRQRPRAVDIYTAPYPGFPTDMQAQFLALNCVAVGTANIVENIFENRFMHVQELIRLGADITLHGNTATVIGRERLTGAPVMATDLRASAGLVLAGLVADGETIVDRIYHIDRGYELIETKLARLGADIHRV